MIAGMGGDIADEVRNYVALIARRRFEVTSQFSSMEEQNKERERETRD